MRAELDRLAPNLRALGYEVERTRSGDRKRARIVTIRKREK
jgi:hypothetical protein